MKELQGPIEARLAPEYFRACIIGAIGIFVSGIVIKEVTAYIQHLDGQPENSLGPLPVIIATIIAAFLLILANTWRLRILPHGVEAHCLFIRRIWNWEDFRQAEAGHGTIYFRNLSPWKRYLGCVYLEDTAAREIWKTLLEHIPPSEKWIGPLTVRTVATTKFTFDDNGIIIWRYFRKRFYSWDNLDRATIFQSGHSERGFRQLILAFGKRTYSLMNVSELRGRSKGPADYDVLEFLVDHVPGEKLVFCAHSGPARSIAEFKARKKDLAKKKLVAVSVGLLLMVYNSYYCCKILYSIITGWNLARNYWGILSISAALYLVGSLLIYGLPFMIWREFRKEEEQLNMDRDVLLR